MPTFHKPQTDSLSMDDDDFEVEDFDDNSSLSVSDDSDDLPEQPIPVQPIPVPDPTPSPCSGSSCGLCEILSKKCTTDNPYGSCTDGYYHRYLLNVNTDFSKKNVVKKSKITEVKLAHLRRHFTDEDFFFCNYLDGTNRLSQIMGYQRLTHHKKLFIQEESCVYFTVYREAAGFDNSIGFYPHDPDNIPNIPKMKKTMIFPTIKNMQGQMVSLGKFSNTYLGFVLVADGNLGYVDGSDMVKYQPEYTYLTDYEFNHIETPDDHKYRHLYIESNPDPCCPKNVKHYFIIFEDLNNPIIDLNGDLIVDANVSFANATFLISIVQKNGDEILGSHLVT